jgi:hypothetical protein
MTDISGLRRSLEACPPGRSGWREFEKAALAVLQALFVPPLQPPRIQPRTFSGLDRRDAIFANRCHDTDTSWGLLHKELDARLIPVEFKNYDREDIGKDEVDQTRNYLRPATMGRLAIVCCNKAPVQSGLLRRNSIFSEEGKVILFLTVEHLKEMLDIHGRGEDAGGFVVDSYEEFLIQHE